uniref:Zinc ABC transporter substrate-binding protein n=1 Tax=Archaeoglobus fulgidus TaxID=2234 RepID=A0A7J3M3K4_ARCFL
MRKTYSIVLTLLLIPIANASVVVSIPDLKSIVERICGEDVESIATANVDPHLFSLTSEELQKVRNAKLLILANSEMLEFEKKIKSLSSETLDFRDYEPKILSFPGIEENYHAYWLLPENTIRIASKVKEKLSEIYPEKREIYEQNFERFVISFQLATKDAEKIVKKMRDYDFIAMDPHTAYAISALNLSVSFVFPEEAFPGAVELGNLNLKKCVVTIADYQRETKIEEMAVKIAEEKQCGIAVLKVVSDLSPESMLIYNAVSLSNPEYKENREDFAVYILGLFAMVEAIIIVALWRSKRKI